MKWYHFLSNTLIEFAKFRCGCVKRITPKKNIAHHQPRPAQHLPAMTSHSLFVSNTLIHTPPEIRQAVSQHNTSHPILRSSTTRDALDNTLRNAFQPHPHSTSTNNTPPTQSNISSNTLTCLPTTNDTPTPSATPSTPFRDQAPPSNILQPHPRSDTTRNIPNNTLSDTLPNTSLPHIRDQAPHDTLDDTLPPQQTHNFRDHPPLDLLFGEKPAILLVFMAYLDLEHFNISIDPFQLNLLSKLTAREQPKTGNAGVS